MLMYTVGDSNSTVYISLSYLLPSVSCIIAAPTDIFAWAPLQTHEIQMSPVFSLTEQCRSEATAVCSSTHTQITPIVCVCVCVFFLNLLLVSSVVSDKTFWFCIRCRPNVHFESWWEILFNCFLHSSSQQLVRTRCAVVCLCVASHQWVFWMIAAQLHLAGLV